MYFVKDGDCQFYKHFAFSHVRLAHVKSCRGYAREQKTHASLLICAALLTVMVLHRITHFMGTCDKVYTAKKTTKPQWARSRLLGDKLSSHLVWNSGDRYLQYMTVQ